jgi:hypothetical protein
MSLNGLNGYSPPSLLRPHPPTPSPGPIKATLMTPGAPHTSPSPSLLLSRAGTPPHRASSEARAVIPMLLSLFCAPTGELWCTGAAGGRTSVSVPPLSGAFGPRRHRSTVDRARPARFTTRGLGSRVSFRKIILGNSNFQHFAFRPLGFSKINPLSKNLQLGPWI